MEFYTVSSTPRPVRLPESIRQWAWDSLNRVYGDDCMTHPAVAMDDIPGFAELSALAQQDAAIRRIAEEAPIRVIPGEKMSGSATLGLSIEHMMPATFGGKPFLESTSHHTPGYMRAIREGVDSYDREISERLKDPALTPGQREFVLSLKNVVDSLRIWHGRYLAYTKEHSPETYELLKQVPFSPARNFREAVQSLWFLFAYMRLNGNWPGIGRIDWILGDYLARDLETGAITMDEAREVLAHFFVKGCEWIRTKPPIGSGDSQHYQNIVMAGLEEDGNEVTNEVTYLILDIIEELGIADFPTTIRINDRTPEKLLRRIAEVMRHGGGALAVYNEKLVLESMMRLGFTEKQVRKFANDGCWEVQLPGETFFYYTPFDGLQVFNRTLDLDGDGPAPDYPDYESLYAAFLVELKKEVDALYRRDVTDVFHMTPDGWRNSIGRPSSVLSLFEEGCIPNARSYFDLGPNYTVKSIHIGGGPDVGNSLLAIKKLVYEEKRMTLPELIGMLRANWEGYEAERLYVRNRYTYYGNDDDLADSFTAQVLNDFADLCAECKSDIPVKFVPGVSTFGRQASWLPERRATAFGAKKGEILSGNASPTPGTDSSGATAIIRSYCKADLVKQNSGAALDIRLFPDTVNGENGVEAIMGLIRGFVALGGFFMQLDVVDGAILRAAQEDPASYRTLSVRVSGWNARFVTLRREWQNMIIERTEQHV